MNLRRIEKVVDGKTIVVLRQSFDEQGRIIRRIEDGKETSFRYDQAGNAISAARDGKPLWERKYDGQGRMIFEERPTEHLQKTIQYLTDGGWTATVTSDKGGSSKNCQYNKKGELVGAKYGDGQEETIVRDNRGRVVSRTVGKDVWRYEFDREGHEIKATVNGITHLTRVYGPGDKWMEETKYARNDGKTVERVRRYEYGKDDQILSETIKDFEKGQLVEEQIIHYRYDLLGRVVEQEDSLYGTERYEYTEKGERKMIFKIPPKENQIVQKS